MDKDIKSIGYGVKVGRNYVGSEDVRQTFFSYVRSGIHLAKNNVKLFDDFDEAKATADDANGKVVELYAREVEDSEDED
ncbi:hypothetical protein [uncultured Limosilactobacillus sp.]|uniref:hypothetical protein n=1 Tax=uncultured Limosilactobacillus sp. TaxID=2837629 RepID=UPI0025D85922|nr:hypothetical protein [uncultured Limosilactobacillus sp.]